MFIFSKNPLIKIDINIFKKDLIDIDFNIFQKLPLVSGGGDVIRPHIVQNMRNL